MITGYERNEENIIKDGARKDRFHSLAPGRTVIRVLPPYSKRGVWFKSILEYVIKLGDDYKFLISPKDSGLPDPLAEYGEELVASGNERLAERARDIRPRRRYIVNALILADSKGAGLKDGVKIVNLPIRVKDSLVNVDTDVASGYGNITHLEQGFNISIERAGEGLQTRYDVRAHRERSNILATAQQQGFDPNDWTLFDLDTAGKPSSLADIQEVLERIKKSAAHTGNDKSATSDEKKSVGGDSGGAVPLSVRVTSPAAFPTGLSVRPPPTDGG